jgi:hypothetical protein
MPQKKKAAREAVVPGDGRVSPKFYDAAFFGAAFFTLVAWFFRLR